MVTEIKFPKKFKSLKPIVIFNAQENLKRAVIFIDNHIWVTARRKKIPVRSMTTSHIKNCIACWEGQGNMEIPSDYLGGKEKWLKIFNQELTNRQ